MTRRGKLTAAALIAVALLCTRLPLLNTLGYEFALCMGLGFAYLAAPFVLGSSRRLARLPGRGVPEGVLQDSVLLTLAGVFLLFPPFVLLMLNAMFVRNCAPLEGALLFVLIPMATVPFVTTLALLSHAMFPRRAWMALFFILLLLFLQPFIEIYSRPQLYSYNHVFGFFVGMSWDQDQPPMGRLALFRVSTFAWVFMMLGVTVALRVLRRHASLTGRNRYMSLLLFMAGVVPAVVLGINSDSLGFTNSMRQLSRELPGRHVSDNFIILFDTSSVTQAEVQFIADEHEFQLYQVSRELGVRRDGRIVSVLYPDNTSKGRLLGTTTSQIARPWRGEIHLSLEYWRGSLKHELVHVLAAEFGPYPIRVPFLRATGLIEGLAMAVEWDYGNRNLHEYAAGMLEYELLPPVRGMMGPGFVTGASSVVYVATGSFTRWLMDTRGVELLKTAYRRDAIERVYSRSYEELESDWHAFLRMLPRDKPDSLAISYLFRRTSLFTAECPRVVSSRSRNASELLRSGDALAAAGAYEDLERLAPSARTAFGLVQAYYQAGLYDSVLALTTRLLDDDSRAYSVFALNLWKAAAAWATGDSIVADASLSLLREERLAGWPTERAERMCRALREFYQDSTVRNHFISSMHVHSDVEAERERQADRAIEMLRDRRDNLLLIEEASIRLAALESRRSDARELIASVPRAERSALMWSTLGQLLYRSGDWLEAAHCFDKAVVATTDTWKSSRIEEWLQRCDWRMERLKRHDMQ